MQTYFSNWQSPLWHRPDMKKKQFDIPLGSRVKTLGDEDEGGLLYAWNYRRNWIDTFRAT